MVKRNNLYPVLKTHQKMHRFCWSWNGVESWHLLVEFRPRNLEGCFVACILVVKVRISKCQEHRFLFPKEVQAMPRFVSIVFRTFQRKSSNCKCIHFCVGKNIDFHFLFFALMSFNWYQKTNYISKICFAIWLFYLKTIIDHKIK